MSEFQLPKPGPAHELLKPFEGTFKAVVELWFGPDNSHVTTGLMTSTFQLGGLWLFQDYKGDAQDGPFPDFAGKGYWGWNFAAKKYEGFWIDSTSPGMQTESGNVDESGKLWTMTCEQTHTHPETGAQLSKRSEIRVKDENHNSLTAFFTDADGNDFKNMHIEYTRV